MLKKAPVILSVLFLAAMRIFSHPSGSLKPADPALVWNPGTFHCTIVAGVSKDGLLVGNNEDYRYPFTAVYIIPSTGNTYGRMLFGFLFPDSGTGYCGGVNEAGLFIDGNGISDTGWKEEPGKDFLSGYDLMLRNFESQVLAKYSTVEEVSDIFRKNNFTGLRVAKMLVADKSGASAVIEWGQNKLQILRRKGNYQISTNFVQSNYPEGKYSDFRYNLAESIFRGAQDITIDVIRKVLNATHWEEYGADATATLYSYICDLKKGDVYIYNFHNFEDAVKLNIHEELKKGKKSYSLLSLFPYETFAEYNFRHHAIVNRLYERAVRFGVSAETGALALFGEIKHSNVPLLRYDLGEDHLNALGDRLFENNKNAEALDVFKFAVKEFPQSADAYDRLGEAYLKMGQKDLALESFKKSLELNPNNGIVAQKLEAKEGEGRAYPDLTSKNYLESKMKELEKAPDDMRLLFVTAKLLRRYSREAAAYRNFQKILKLDPQKKSEYHFESLFWSIIYDGLFNKKTERLIDFIKRYEDYDGIQVAHRYVVKIFLEKGEIENARAYAEKILQKEIGDPYLTYDLGWWIESNQLKELYPVAIEYFKKALAVNAEDPGMWDTLGWLYFRNGDKAKAVEAEENALKLDPQNKDYKANLEKFKQPA